MTVCGEEKRKKGGGGGGGGGGRSREGDVNEIRGRRGGREQMR